MSNNVTKKIIKLRNTPTLTAKSNLLYLQEVGYQPSVYTERTEPCQIDSYIVILVIKGIGFVNYDDIEYRVSEGQCIYLNCNSLHSFRCDVNCPWEVLWLYFNGNSAPYYYNLFSKKRCNVFLPQRIHDLTSIIYEIIANNVQKNANTEIINSKLITDILTMIISTPSIHGPIESYSYQMKSIMEYIDSHFTENINLDDLSAAFYMNKYYITREFKKEYGETIFQHIIKRRIDYAKELLSSTNETIEDIAEICGFNDQSYFSRQFKKVTGINSLCYRKLNKQNSSMIEK